MANVSSSNGLEKRPKLRFPGFDEPWEHKELLHYLVENTDRNKQLKFGKENVLSVSGEYGIVNQIAFQGRSFAGESVADYHVVETDDIVYTKSPLKAKPYGIIKVNNGVPGIVSTLYAVYHPLKTVVPRFVDFYFSNDLRLNKFLKPLVNIGAKHDMKVNNTFVLTGMVVFPPLREQQKIVDFLTILDRRIDVQRKKVEALKKYKRGVMRAIFRGKAILFSETTKWKSVRLGDECTFFSGGTPRSTDSSFYGGEIPFIRSGEIHGAKTELFLTDDGLKYSSAKLVSKGDLIVALYGATSGEVDISQIDGAINQAILCIRPKLVNRTFLKYLLEDSKDDILNTYLQGGQGNLSAEIIKNLVFDIPDDRSQSAVVDFLDMIDQRISKSLMKLESIATLRSALMQQLFI